MPLLPLRMQIACNLKQFHSRKSSSSHQRRFWGCSKTRDYSGGRSPLPDFFRVSATTLRGALGNNFRLFTTLAQKPHATESKRKRRPMLTQDEPTGDACAFVLDSEDQTYIISVVRPCLSCLCRRGTLGLFSREFGLFLPLPGFDLLALSFRTSQACRSLEVRIHHWT